MRRPAFDVPADFRRALWLIFAGYLAFIVYAHVEGYAAADRGERPFYTDFTHRYGASLLLREQPAENLFRTENMTAAMQDAARAAYGEALSPEMVKAVGFGAWMYPPVFLFVTLPLALLPYLASLMAWTAATALPYLAAMRAITRETWIWPLALAAPPVLHNAMYGQTGFLIAGLIGLGLTQLRCRPVIAGVLIGLACIKPHLGLLIPLALACGGHWRSFASATVTTLALVVASAWVFGIESWYATLGSVGYYFDGFAAGAYNLKAMTSVFSMVRTSGGAIDLAWTMQQTATAVVAMLVAWVWWHGRRQPESLGLRSAVLCLAAPLASPMVYLYDLVLIAPAAAWILCDLRARGAHPWEFALLALPLSMLLVAYDLAQHLGLQIGALCVAAILVLAVHRYRLGFPSSILQPLSAPTEAPAHPSVSACASEPGRQT